MPLRDSPSMTGGEEKAFVNQEGIQGFFYSVTKFYIKNFVEWSLGKFKKKKKKDKEEKVLH